jgi:hypothetical protein
MKKYFAQINQSNTVVKIITVDSQPIEAHGGDKSVAAENWMKKVFKIPEGHKWVQTSKDSKSNFRKKPAGIGYRYDSNLDIFITPQPYDSWIFTSNNDWEAPIPYPSITEGYVISWDETNQQWKGFKGVQELSTWNPDTNSWSDPTP